MKTTINEDIQKMLDFYKFPATTVQADVHITVNSMGDLNEVVNTLIPMGYDMTLIREKKSELTFPVERENGFVTIVIPFGAKITK